jgi:ribonucleoside-triphosphate reductase
MDQYQEYIHKSRYARFLSEEGRRETWDETVARSEDFWAKRLPNYDDNIGELNEVFKAVRDLEVMPSMRCLMTAGEALERDNVAGFNCSYLPIDHPRAFDELMYILLCGTGVGFSVESTYVDKLPEVPEEFHETDTTIVVPDSKIGWAKSFRQLISLLYAGEVPAWDVSKVRAAGEPLKTFGGRASGPEPLEDLFAYTIRLFQKAQGRKLLDLECHDLCCKVGDIVVVGGVRRSALISLSDPVSQRMAGAKSGEWRNIHPERELANNSACYKSKPDFSFFLREMESLYSSYSGERGVFSREAAKKIVDRSGRRDSDYEFGTNPCSEIILRPNQFCNLSEVVVRPEDTLEVLKGKVEKATILGTLQSSLTDFRYLRSIWKKNTEEEALLGVSLTGIMDHPVLSGEGMGRFGEPELEEWLAEMKEVAIETNKKWAEILGVNPSVAITCVKPSGTVSQLVNSSSGIHPRYSPHYIRRVTSDGNDPLCKLLVDQGVPHEMKRGGSGAVLFKFPIEGPEDSPSAGDVHAMEQLKLWKVYQDHWCEHKPSVTVYYRDDDFLQCAQWMWEEFDTLSGIALLPYDGHVYEQAPYEPISKEEYEKLEGEFPTIDWSKLGEYETEDYTTGSQELACVGNLCDIT